MAIEIEVPGKGVVEFPDGTPEDVMRRALVKDHNRDQQASLEASNRRLDVLTGALDAVRTAVDVPAAVQAVWSPVSQSAEAWGRLAGAVASDVGGKVASGQLNAQMPNTAAVLAGGENPAKAALAETPGTEAAVKRGMLSAVEGAPLLGVSMAAQAAGVPAPVAFGAPMAAEALTRGASPMKAATEGAIGAVIPGVFSASERSAASALAGMVKSGWLSPASTTAQKAVEAAAGTIGTAGLIEATKLPEYAAMPPEKRREALIESVASQGVYALMSLPKFRAGIPSDTQQALRNDAEFIVSTLLERAPQIQNMAPDQVRGFALDPANDHVFRMPVEAAAPKIAPEPADLRTSAFDASAPLDFETPPRRAAAVQTAGEGTLLAGETSPVDQYIETYKPKGGGKGEVSQEEGVQGRQGEVTETAPPPADAGGEPPLTEHDLRSAMLAIIGGRETSQQKAVRIRQTADRFGMSVKDLQERIESEIVIQADKAAQAEKPTPDQKWQWMRLLYDRQPVMSARTSTSVENQAYSTPAPLAFSLKHALDVTRKTSVYEPTGGNGMLLIGSDLARSHGNELNKTRAEALRRLGVGTVTEHDATKFAPEGKFDVVTTNPPFGGIDNVNWKGFGLRKLEHLIAAKALEAMRDDGKAALILGAKREPGPDTAKGADWVFGNYLYGHYNVVGDFEVSGDLYAKQGAKWPVRVVVIDGRKANPEVADLAPTQLDRYDNWDQVWSEAERIRGEIERRRAVLGAGGQSGLPVPAPAGTPAAPQPTGVPEPARPAGRKTGGGGGREGARGGGAASGGQSSDGGVGGSSTRPPAQTGERAGTGRIPAGVGKPETRVDPGLRPEGDLASDGPRATGGGGERPRPAELPKPPAVVGTEFQTPYAPRSAGTPFGTLTPKGIAGGTAKALDDMVARVGPVDDFVAGHLNLPVDELRSVMSAEQIDGVALAIDQIQTGGALVIGDETGIGKGRQAAAVIRYAKLQGKIPVFFTKDPKLFTDMFGDLRDIHTEVRPFLLGDPAKASIVDADGDVLHRSPTPKAQAAEMARIEAAGWKASGYDAVFATYSQVFTRNARQLFLERLADANDVILILDEAHEAAGDADTSMQAAFMMGGEIKRGSGADKETIVLPGLLRAAGTAPGRGGVVYLSATYAKRSENLPVYFRTALHKAADSFDSIVTAMEKGGTAIQQAVSEALAKVGQYVRRERDFTGVSYDMRRLQPKDPARLVRHVDQVTGVLQRIVAFSQALRAGIKGATAQTEEQHSMTDFASVVHNQIGQLLLAAKAESVVEEAVAAHKRGEKPVIALMNTMGSFLDSFVTEAGIKPGKPIQIRWGELLKHALERCLRMKIKDPTGGSDIERVDPYAAGVGAEYDAIRKLADTIATDFPTSPIDYIIQRCAQEGVRIAELTGREAGIEYTDLAKGEAVYRVFPKANKNAVVTAFNSGKVEGMLLNASGSTGLSAHASEKFTDQRPRHMIIAQPALDINVFVQTLGRIKRTGMVLTGKDAKGNPYGARYSHLVLPLQAELRPSAIAARKMKSLNANTTAEADAAVKIEAEDILNKYGDSVVAEYLMDNPELGELTGLGVEIKQDGTPKVVEGIARRMTGRMAYLPDATQQKVYAEIMQSYRDLVEQKKATGEYDLEIAVHEDWDGVREGSEVLVPGTDESNIFTAPVRVERWQVRDSRHVPTGQEMVAEMRRRSGGPEQIKLAWDKASARIDENLSRAISAADEDARSAEARVKEAGDKALERLTGARTRWESSRELIRDLLDTAGRVVRLENLETGEEFRGMLVEAKMPTVANFGARRLFRFRFLVEAPDSLVVLSANDLGTRWRVMERGDRVEDMGGRPANSRYSRYVVVGNPVRGYDATGGAGKMVRFKARGGDVVTGLLMPHTWNPGKLARDPRLDLVNGKAVAKYVSLGRPATIADGVARLERARWGNSYTISTSSAKSTGGVVYLDAGVRAITGDFTKRAGKMVATVYESQVPLLAEAVSRALRGRWRAGSDAIRGNVESANQGEQPMMSVEEALLPRRVTDEVPVPDGPLTSLAQIRDYVAQAFDLPVREGRFRQRAAGLFKPVAEVVRLRRLNDVPTLAHELGHYIDTVVRPDMADPAFDSELLPLALGKTRSPRLEDRRREGVAEFTRLWLTDPAAALVDAPSFLAHFESTMAADRPVAFDALTTAREMVQRYIRQPAMTQVRSRISRDPRQKRRSWRDLATKTIDDWVNELGPMERALDRLQAFGASPDQCKLTADLAVNYIGGWRGKAEHSLKQEQTDLDGNSVGPSLRKILDGLDLVEFGDYLVAKQELELWDQGKLSGLKAPMVADQRREVAALDAKYASAKAKLKAYMANDLHLLVESGVLSEAQFSRIQAAYSDYVPLYRVIESFTGGQSGPAVGSGFVDLPQGVRRRKGSDRQIVDPIESIVKNSYAFRDLAERNRVAVEFIKSAESVQGGGRVVESVARRMKPVKVSGAEMLDHLTKLGIEVPEGTDVADLAMTVWRLANQRSARDGIVTVWREGEAIPYQLGSPDLARALALADRDIARMAGAIPGVKLLRTGTAALRAGATLSPEFMARNPFRDQWTAAVYSRHGFVPIWDGFRGLLSAVRRDDLYHEWVKSGGRYSDFVGGDRDSLRDALADVVKQPGALRQALSWANPLNVVRNLQIFSETMEMATRLSEFRRAKEAGLNDLAAANASKDVTLNFARAGFKGKLFNQLVAFYNAGIQDFSKFARAHRQDPVGTTFRALLYVTTPSLLCWFLGKDDKEYQNLPQWRRDYFWNVNVGTLLDRFGVKGGPRILSFPKPFLLGQVYGSSAERGLDYLTGRDPNAARKWLQGLLLASPFTADGLVPTAVRPILESWANRSFWTKAPIESEAMRRLPVTERYGPQTSLTARGLANMIPWESNLSPVKIDNYIRGYFAGLGRYGTDATDYLIAKWTGGKEPDPPAKSLTERPVFRAFVRSPYEASAYVQRFYDASDRANRTVASFDRAADTLDTAAAQRDWQRSKADLLWYKEQIGERTRVAELNRVRDRLAVIHRAMQTVQTARELSPDTKRARLITLSKLRDSLAEAAYRTLVSPADRARTF